jgi:hypothetical protein
VKPLLSAQRYVSASFVPTSPRPDPGTCAREFRRRLRRLVFDVRHRVRLGRVRHQRVFDLVAEVVRLVRDRRRLSFDIPLGSFATQMDWFGIFSSRREGDA